MGRKEPRIDAYIADSAEFAKPILRELRSIVHEACPEVEETMKWSFPHFMYEGMLCSMASFKEHCAFGFWRGKEIVPGGAARNAEATGHLGRREYVEWITEARREETRDKRVAQALEWRAEGKPRNWKYM